MAIKFKCACGRVVKAPDGSVGKHGKCPACGAAVTVPELIVPQVVEEDPVLAEVVEEAERTAAQEELPKSDDKR